jgi:hypothetical protein
MLDSQFYSFTKYMQEQYHSDHIEDIIS